MGPLSSPVPIVAAGVASVHGFEWRGLSRVVESHRSRLASSLELPALPEPQSVPEKRARTLMSRSAILAAAASRLALEQARWAASPEAIGFYLGVGASGGDIEQLQAMLSASIDDHDFSLARFGDPGLRAANPLFAFQLMNNFTLCHGAILLGTQGPNAAFFSRGSGTVVALYDAAQAVLEDECPGALAGGADSCVHPVTWAELAREGWVERGLVAGEGAALLALTGPGEPANALGFIDHVSVHPSRGQALGRALAESEQELVSSTVDAVIVAPWGPPARDALLSLVSRALPGRPVLDATSAFGESLAAGPALAWVVALDLLAAERLGRVLVLSAGIDGDVGTVTIGSRGIR
jgi:hypothetical protein